MSGRAVALPFPLQAFTGLMFSLAAYDGPVSLLAAYVPRASAAGRDRRLSLILTRPTRWPRSQLGRSSEAWLPGRLNVQADQS